MKAWASRAAFALALTCAPPLYAADVLAEPFPADGALRFLQAEEAQAFLSESDAYVEALGPGDLLLRFGSTEVSYVERAASAARSWSDEETAKIEQAIAMNRAGFAARRIGLPLPEEILLIKTSGAEEGYAGNYTRRNAIIFSESQLQSSPVELALVLAHELFHVATRRRPDIRDALYATVGFRPCPAAALPASLASRVVTNPDAFHLEHCITIAHDGAELSVMPLLLTDGQVGVGELRPLFQAIEVGLVALQPDGTAVTSADGAPMLLAIGTEDYLARIGANTGYIIHPEEILADNFALLALGASGLPNPEISERIQAVLSLD